MAKVMFGKKLDDVMKAKDVDRDQLSLRSGQSIHTIGKWLRGERMPGSEELGRICEALGVSCAEFMPSILAADPASRPKLTRGRPPKEPPARGKGKPSPAAERNNRRRRKS